MNDKWISVKDKLPGYDKPVLWVYESGLMVIFEIDKDFNADYLDYILSGLSQEVNLGPITHWMELPEAPE